MKDKRSDTSVQIIAAIIGATAICIAAIIGLLQPIVSLWAENKFSANTQLPFVNPTSETPFLVSTNAISTNTPEMVASTSVSVLPKYEIVSLENFGVYESGNLGLQAGIQTLSNINFEIGWLITTRSQDTPNSVDTILLYVEQTSKQVSKIHFLLQAGWGFVSNNTEIGKITITFSDGRTLVEPLKIGYNIRDWSKVNSPLTSSNSQQIWNGTSWDGKTQGVIDMLTINISNDYNSTYITRIEITDESMENLNSLNPAIHLWAITMER